jgi:hypothetical protein
MRQRTFEAAWRRHTASDRHPPHNRYDSIERPCFAPPAPAAPGQEVDAVGYAGSMITFVLIGVRE